MHMTLPTRITLLIGLTVMLFLVTVCGTVVLMTLAMDRRATEDSVRLMSTGVAGIRETIDSNVSDYSNWDDAYFRIQTRDFRWLEENVIGPINTSETYQLLQLFGGRFPEPVIWTEKAGLLPSVGHPAGQGAGAVRRAMRRSIEAAEPGPYETVHFTGLLDGVPFLFSGSYIWPHSKYLAESVDPADLAIMILGRRLPGEVMTRLRKGLLLEDLTFTASAPPGRPSLALVGADGTPAGHLSWQPPRPGSELLARMALPLGALGTAFLFAAGFAGLTARRSALSLVRQKEFSGQMARRDALTGLPNRYALHEFLEARPLGRLDSHAVLYMDVNGFKRVNDTLGHEAGDQLVKDLAARLDALLGDDAFLARVGGDEFVYVCTGEGAGERVRAFSEGVREAAAQSFEVRGHVFSITVAQGYAVNDAPRLDAEELMRRADLAMYHAKRSGAPGAVAYSERIETGSREDRLIEDALRAGLEREDEFAVFYQPIVDAGTGRLVKAEALARWTSATVGAVPPDRFIAIAERGGMIVELGRVLLRRICRDLVADPELRVSVNVSPLQLQAQGFVRELESVLAEHGVGHDRIELELTEGLAVENAELAAYKLDLLQDLGFETSLDDFGTGFSSIGYLRRLPFDTLKIDRSFVSAFEEGCSNLQMVNSIVLMGHSLGKTVICEGVETAAQAEILHGLGCDLLQGYHFGRPMPLARLREAYPPAGAPPAARAATPAAPAALRPVEMRKTA